LESKHKYGVLGAGAVRTSLIGRLPKRACAIGPVCSTSYRVASRIANSVGAGYPVRSAAELRVVRAVLVSMPPEHLEGAVALLRNAAIDWRGKALIFCDCAPDPESRREFGEKGASTAVAREFGTRLIAEGEDRAALRAVQGLARELGLKPVEISKGAGGMFGAAVLLGSAAITPLIDRAAELLRAAGIRDGEASRMAASLFAQTARDYAHSGRQSWAWYARGPDAARLEAQALREPILRDLVLYGLERFGKHEELRNKLLKK
jgi:predicted short-subunit dehydrogenase-like oxidoreductase (DUF2520 family)